MLPVLLACGAAAVFAAGTSLQHREANDVSHAGLSAPGLLWRLLRRTGWLLGLALSGVAFALHVAALHRGALILVQPIVVSNIVFAVFVGAALDRRLPARPEVVWAIVTWAGLSLFIGVLEPRHGRPRPPFGGAETTYVMVALAVTALAVLWAGRTHHPARRGLLYGVAAGALFGLTAGLIKVVLTQAPLGPGFTLRHGSVWVLAFVGVNALLVSQRAYHAARLSVTVPILNIIDVLVAIGFGYVVFGERLFSTPGRLAAEIVGLVVMGVGVWQLARQEEEVAADHHQPAGVTEAGVTDAAATAGSTAAAKSSGQF